MKTQLLTLCGLTVIFLVGLATLASAQINEIDPKTREIQWKNNSKKSSRSNLDINNTLHIASFLYRDDVQKGLGVSKEQYQKITDVTMKLPLILNNDPEYQSINDEITKLNRESNFDLQNAPEEIQKKVDDLEKKLVERTQNLVNEKFTPDQMKKIKEFQISIMSEGRILSPNMFEVLDLSDAQKEQFEKIKKEMAPEFEKYLDKETDVSWKFNKRHDELRVKLEGITDPEERQKIEQDIIKKLLAEFQQESNEVRNACAEYSKKLKFKMFDVLTDEQLKRMINLIDNPPDYVKGVIAQIREWSKRDEPEKWQPGVNSWKPGDPIPEEYLKHREERKPFPMTE